MYWTSPVLPKIKYNIYLVKRTTRKVIKNMTLEHDYLRSTHGFVTLPAAVWP